MTYDTTLIKEEYSKILYNIILYTNIYTKDYTFHTILVLLKTLTVRDLSREILTLFIILKPCNWPFLIVMKPSRNILKVGFEREKNEKLQAIL